MLDFTSAAAAAVNSSSAAVILTQLKPSLEFRDVAVYLKPTGATMTEFYIDVLVPGSGITPVPSGSAETAAWVNVWDHTNDETDKEVRRLGGVTPGNATSGNWGFGWWRLPPCTGIRLRAKANGSGTVDVRMGLGHS